MYRLVSNIAVVMHSASHNPAGELIPLGIKRACSPTLLLLLAGLGGTKIKDSAVITGSQNQKTYLSGRVGLGGIRLLIHSFLFVSLFLLVSKAYNII
jgi:hypothetical protein